MWTRRSAEIADAASDHEFGPAPTESQGQAKGLVSEGLGSS